MSALNNYGVYGRIERRKGLLYKNKVLRLVTTKHSIPFLKHGGSSIMIWILFAASGPGQLATIDGAMNSK